MPKTVTSIMIGVNKLIILAVGLVCVNSQTASLDPNARTLATGGTEFVVAGGTQSSNPTQTNSAGASLLDLAMESFGQPQTPTSSQTGTGTQSNGDAFMDTVNSLLNPSTSQIDPSFRASLGLPADPVPIDPTINNYPSNPGTMIPASTDPISQTSVSGSFPIRDPNAVPLTDPNAGPVTSNISPGSDPNAIGSNVVVQVDSQSGMNRGGITSNTGALPYNPLPDPNTVGNVLDPNAPLPTDSTYTIQGQAGIYPRDPIPGSVQPTSQPSQVGPMDYPAIQNGGAIDPTQGPGQPLDSTMTGANLASANLGPTALPSAPPSGSILSSMGASSMGMGASNMGMGQPGAGMPSGPLAALKASTGAKKAVTQPKQDPMMEMLIMSMLFGGGEMNPAMMAMAMSAGGGGSNMSAMLPFLLTMNA